jgi:type II pantothenate kinase
MPWFGLDIGGTLVKVVFFDPKETYPHEEEILARTRAYLKSSKAYGTTGKRDAHLEMPCSINGRDGVLHFIRFATIQMPEFIRMAKEKGLAELINDVCATGGGANKFEEEIRSNLNVKLQKSDELDSVIYGIHFIDQYNSDRECFYIQNPLDAVERRTVRYDFNQPYPYLVVNIGSGVSMLAVYSSKSYSRVYGSNIGGGTFEGLCCSLTKQQLTFEEAIDLAQAGNANKVNKLVKDIYGGDYTKFDLKGDLVASSFGNMNNPIKREQALPEDYARGVLEMVTLNIASQARLCAKCEKINRVVFIGNFLRVNQLSMQLLAYAFDYWSKGEIKALFLEHEGYFGAVGCLVESTQSQTEKLTLMSS